MNECLLIMYHYHMDKKNPNYTCSNLTSVYTDRSTDAVVRNQNLSSASDLQVFFKKFISEA